MQSRFYKSRWFWALILFFVTIIGYVMPVKDWRFWWDSYGAAHFGCVKSFEEIKSFFSSRPNDLSVFPSNACEGCCWTFLNVMYRPLTLVKYAIQMYFVGPNLPFVIYFITISLHALAVLVFFFLLSGFLPLISSCFGAFFFALHPSVFTWIGQFCCQSFHLTIICLGICLILLQNFVKKGNYWRIFFATIFFAIPLWMHELSIVFPFWLAISLYVIRFENEKLRIILPFFIVLGLYLFAKLMIYPLDLYVKNAIFDPFNFHRHLLVKIKHFDFIDMFKDLFGLNWLPYGYRFFKFILFSIVCGGITAIFYKCTEKREFMAFFLGCLMFFWLSIVWSHRARYAYPAIPFLISALLYGTKKMERARFLLYLYMGSLSFWGVLWGGCVLRARSEKRIFADNAIRKFVQNNPKLQKTPCFFVGIPMDIFPQGMTQGVWLHRRDSSVETYFDQFFNFRFGCDESLLFLPEKGCAKIDFEGDLIKGSFFGVVVENHLRNKRSLKMSSSMGDAKINCFDREIVTFELRLADKYRKKDCVLVSWDCFKNEFYCVGIIPARECI